MANVNENAVVEATENTEEKVGFFKKHGKKLAIAGGILGAIGAGVLGYAIGKNRGSNANTTADDSDDYSSESNESDD